MNSTQRKFLIEKIQTETKKKIGELRKTLLEHPNANNWLFNAVMTGNLEIQSREHILEVVKQKALNSSQNKNWLSNESMGWERYSSVKFGRLSDIFVIPEDYKNEIKRVEDFNKSIKEKIDGLEVHLNTIEMRIQLSSDSVLKKLINEIDDMGDIKLIDTTVKKLNK